MFDYGAEDFAYPEIEPGSRAAASNQDPGGQAGTAQTSPWVLSDGCGSYPVMVPDFAEPGEEAVRKRGAGARDRLGIAWRGATTERLFGRRESA
jgi:hypothetical protein